MPRKIAVLDTNIIVRYLVNDNSEQANKVRQLFQSSKPESLYIPDAVIAEIVYVLMSTYQLSKDQVIVLIDSLIKFPPFILNRKLMSVCLDYFKKTNTSFIDSYLLATAAINQDLYICSFDKSLIKQSKGLARTL